MSALLVKRDVASSPHFIMEFPIFQLAYLSTTVREMEVSELIDLLRVSRSNNLRLGITGMLIYRDQSVIQVIEGLETDVRGLYEKIVSDPRHFHVTTILEEPLVEREFPDWSMAFRAMTPVQEESYSHYLELPWTPEKLSEPSIARMLLNRFKRWDELATA